MTSCYPKPTGDVVCRAPLSHERGIRINFIHRVHGHALDILRKRHLDALLQRHDVTREWDGLWTITLLFGQLLQRGETTAASIHFEGVIPRSEPRRDSEADHERRSMRPSASISAFRSCLRTLRGEATSLLRAMSWIELKLVRSWMSSVSMPDGGHAGSGSTARPAAPGLSHKAAAQGRRASASLERRTRQARGEVKRAGAVDRPRHPSAQCIADCQNVSSRSARPTISLARVTPKYRPS